MYIIHCCVRNNTRIILPLWTFVNGVFSLNNTVLTSLYISPRILPFLPYQLVILPKRKFLCLYTNAFSRLSVVKHSGMPGILANIFPFLSLNTVFPRFCSDDLQNSHPEMVKLFIYPFGYSLCPFHVSPSGFEGIPPSSLCIMPYSPTTFRLHCINIRILYIRNASRFREAFITRSIKNSYCCFPGCSCLQSRSSGRQPLHRNCTEPWWVPG